MADHELTDSRLETGERASAIAEWRQRLGALGIALTPDLIEGTKTLCEAQLDPAWLDGVDVVRDEAYGDDERHRLDVYTEAGDTAGAESGESGNGLRPVLLYVHGGGFVAGDKSGGGTPFGPNIGAWAARNGFVGVVTNYRLAPAAVWPAGGEDVARAVRWLREHAAGFGGDPERIVLVGQSAGAVHVADALRLLEGEADARVAGAVLVSGVFDLANAADNPMNRVYFGEDRDAWAEKETLDALVDGSVPLLFLVAEFDDVQFQANATAIAARWSARTGEFPPLVSIPSHNHLSTVYAIGTPVDRVGRHLLEFVTDRVGRPA